MNKILTDLILTKAKYGAELHLSFKQTQCEEKKKTVLLVTYVTAGNQRWSRGHKARGQGQGHKKNPRPRTGMLEAKAKDQGHKCKCFPKKKGLKNFFHRSQKKKNSLEKHFSADLQNFDHSKNKAVLNLLISS